MQLYPAFLDLKKRKCLVIGDDADASRKAINLHRAGADVQLIGPPARHLPDAITIIADRSWQATDLNDCWLVIACCTANAANQQIADACERERIFCQIPQRSGRASFQIPAIVDRSPIVVAISSSGQSPVLTRVLKSKLEALIPAAYANLAAVVAEYRDIVKHKLPNASQRAAFWHKLINGPTGELAFNSAPDTLRTTIDGAVAQLDNVATNNRGQVSLVGAGPGDPDLLTFRALRLVQSADVIVYDRLVSQPILAMCRTDCELIYAGKARADHSIPQGSINQLLVELALSGKNVVRLKGGDPFIFGRGGEEIETLAAQGIGFQVVPGITAASGCAAFGGIPLTHRDHAQSCVFVTGHLRNGEVNMNWQDLQDPTQTIVVYMGLIGLETICRSLIHSGRSADTAAALIEQGTTQRQRVLTGSLATLPAKVAASEVRAPTLLIIGSVVSLHKQLQWFHPINRALS